MNSSTGCPRHWLGWALAFAAVGAMGCGGGVPRHRVAGTVTHAGKTVERGSITFEPTESVGKIAPTGTAKIENGKFETARDQSPTTGRYVVRVVIHDMNVIREMEKNPKKEFVGTLNRVPPYELTVEIPPPGGQLNIDVPDKSSPDRGGPR
jgi:hypothetical protein